MGKLKEGFFGRLKIMADCWIGVMLCFTLLMLVPIVDSIQKHVTKDIRFNFLFLGILGVIALIMYFFMVVVFKMEPGKWDGTFIFFKNKKTQTDEKQN